MLYHEMIELRNNAWFFWDESAKLEHRSNMMAAFLVSFMTSLLNFQTQPGCKIYKCSLSKQSQ